MRLTKCTQKWLAGLLALLMLGGLIAAIIVGLGNHRAGPSTKVSRPYHRSANLVIKDIRTADLLSFCYSVWLHETFPVNTSLYSSS